METTAKAPEKNDKLDKIVSLAEKQFDTYKVLATEISTSLKKVVISDDASLGMATQSVSKANEIYKKLEERRKLIKDPYLQIGKKIDEIAKTLLIPLDEGIESVRVKMKEWNTKQDVIRAKADAEANTLRVKLDKIIAQLTEKSDAAKTPNACQNLIDSINKVYPLVETFGMFAKEAQDVKDKFITLLNTKQQALTDLMNATPGNTEQVAKMNEVIESTRAATAEISEITKEKKEEAVAAVASATSKTKTRKVWKFEVVDPKALPREWLMPNPDVIRSFMEAGKKDWAGQAEINGVRFFLDETPIIT